MRRLHVLRSVVTDSRLRRLEAAYLLFAIVEHGTWLAVTVFAFGRGGAGEAGLVAFGQLAPAAAVAPLAAYAGDRFRRDVVLAVGVGLVGLALGATGLLLTAGASAWAVYVAAAAAASAMTVVHPAVDAIVPAVTDDPESLTAANVSIELVDSVGIFAGPVLAGLIIATGSFSTVFLGAAAVLVISALLVVSIRYEPSRVRPTGDITAGVVGAELRRGLSLAMSDRRVRMILVLMSLGFVVAGALDVLFVVVAIDLLDRGEALAGVLSSASGLGGFAGAAGSVMLIGASRLRRPLLLAACMAGPPLVLIAIAPSAAGAIAVMIAVGAGLSLLSVTSRTLVQRTTPDDLLVRVFGVIEGASQLSLAVGALGAGLIADAIDIETALVVAAVILPLAVLLGWQTLKLADETSSIADPDAIAMLRAVDLFAPLGSAVIEQLALGLRPVRAEPGDVVIREGDRGDRFFIIASGSVEVVRSGGSTTLAAGESFGEVALVRDVARTATVTATEDSRFWAMSRQAFLEAVTGHPVVHDEARRVADDRLHDTLDD